MAGDWLAYSRQPPEKRNKKTPLTRNWSEAPPELLSLILSNLFFKDRLNFKQVCRSWSSRSWFTQCPPFFYNGVFYCVNSSSRGLTIFDPKKNGRDRWIPDHDIGRVDENKIDYWEEMFEQYIAEVDGEICCVFVTNEDRKVSVRKWDFAVSRWKELESLGDKCLYVSRTGMFAETCISGMENKIYFNKFRGKSGVLYSLATKMYRSVEGDFASRCAYGLAHAAHGSWIKFNAL